MSASSEQPIVAPITDSITETDADELKSTLQLCMLPGLGPRTLRSLLDYFGTPEQVLTASGPQLAAVHGVGPKLIHTIRTATHHVDPNEILSWCREHGCRLICRGGKDYPQGLEDLVDAPPILFVRGSLDAADEMSVAMVGTRHASTYGLQQAERLSYGLARAGVTVISGLARGIDTAAHNGAINGGGRTIAVLGGGLGKIYPKENAGLAKAIAADGAVISEYAPHATSRAGMFPQRNRLIASLSLATLVIEAPDRSGSLITANLAAEQNRTVLALPGPVTSRTSRGTNQLIRDGAVLIQTVDDILEALGPMNRPVSTADGNEVRNPAELKLNELERQVLSAIGETSTPIDSVIAASGLPAHRVVATISVLEMRRLIRRLSGQYVSRV
ncbi:DNA-processing protein DprA [Stieleria varia]|uniref:Uncharacterized protein n=1 Tax=Stieleria varia TaxID=2528005 RepID=A0A5C6B2E0_9BACT|nr:DNA-processing protein DprA [Stieleria varia]TWU04564.1 hypothetical protein Pla52n_26060 [Stieleria varia]